MSATSSTALRRFLPSAAVFAIAFVTFLPGLPGECLNWDDDVNFLSNRDFRGLGWSNLRWMATRTHKEHWIPLTWLTLGANYALGGIDPWGYHLVDLVIHSASAVLFYFAARLLLAAAGTAAGEPALSAGSAFAALLFAVHPLRGGYEAQTGRFSEALPHLRKAYALDSTYLGMVKELAGALVAAAAAERKAGRPAEALALYQKALAVQPANAQAREGLEALSAGRPAGGARR